MSTLIDKYNIINIDAFPDISEENIYRDLLNNNNNLFDYEKILNLKREVSPTLINGLIKHRVKEIKKELNYQITREKNINIDNFTKKMFDCIEKIRLVGLLNNRCLLPNNEKIFGDFSEIDTFVENFKKNIIEDTKIRYIFFKNLLSDKEETQRFIKLIFFLDKYNNFYNDFLEGYGEYILSDNYINFGKGMCHLELYNLYQNFKIVKSYKRLFRSENFLKHIKIKLLDLLAKFVKIEENRIQKFIINNSEMCKDLILMSDEINYKQDLLVSIFVLLDKHDFLVKNLVSVFEFVSKINNHLDKVKTTFVKKILMKQIANDYNKIDVLIDYIISGDMNKNFINLISSNELVVNYIHEQMKKKLSTLIINQHIGMKQLYKLEKLLENSVFKKLHHDISIIIYDNDFSEKFSKNISENFNIKTTIYALNSNFWALNFSEGFIETKKSIWDLSSDKTNNFNNIYRIICSSYSIATNDKRKFRLIGHLGNVEFDYTSDNITKKIRMLPIQSYLFQKIYDYSLEISRKELKTDKSINNYNSKFINELINSLIKGNIIIEKDNFLSVNTDISNIKTDYVDILYTDSVKKVMKYQPVYDKTTVISCWINKFVKLNNCKLGDLYKKIVTELDCGVIKINKSEFNNTIEQMVKNDYIQVEDGIASKNYF
tara:strand:+ start:5810 stop:7786 length:1977 start_codon:yes stop_codon:yes gene_type:complete